MCFAIHRRSIFVPEASSSHLADSSSTVERSVTSGCENLNRTYFDCSGGGAELREQISQMMYAEKRISAGMQPYFTF